MQILIIRTSAIGDIVLTSPLAESLKLKFPYAKLTWLVQPENKALLADNPFVDELIVWDRKEISQFWRAKDVKGLWDHLDAYKEQLRSRQFDLCVDAQGLFKSGIFAYLSGAKKKVGLGSKEGSQWFMDKVIPKNLGDTTMICSEYQSLAKALTGSDYFNLRNYYSELSKRSAASKLRAAMQSESGEYIVFAPFTTRDEKHWFIDYWVSLANKISTHFELPIVMLGAPADYDKSLSISNNSSVINLVGKTDLQEAAAIINDAKSLVSVDTGLAHMGQAAKIATLCFFGATKPYLKTPLPNQRILHYPCLCDGNRKATRPDNGGCMRDLTPEIAFEQFQVIMG